MNQTAAKLLVTDFDGTMCRRDFYSSAVDHLLTPDDLAPWHDYTAGKITHFESLRRIFFRIRASEDQMSLVLREMQFDPNAADAIHRLRSSGWKVRVVSNGCDWYIKRLFHEHKIQVELHSNPGEYSAEAGLQMRLPRESPFFCEELGISKAAVVRHALDLGYQEVAFAGDGRPDLEPALMVTPTRRFARGWLAETLTQRGEPFDAFENWSEIADRLCEQR